MNNLTKQLSITFTIALFCTTISGFSQKEPAERYPFKNVSKEEMSMTSCSFEPDAPAMVLGDKEDIHISAKGNYVVYATRHLRIKVFKEEGKSAGMIEIPLYKDKDQNEAEEASEIEGYTYNLINGRIEKTEITSSCYHQTAINDHWDVMRIEVPHVQEGSVIDLSYSKSSNFPGQIDTWYFQRNIPVNWSEVIVNFGNEFTYNYDIQGYIPFAINAFACKSEDELSRLAREYNGYVLAVSKAPSVKEDNYMTTSKDYMARLKMELSSYTRRDGMVQKYRDSWKNLTYNLLNENFVFGNQYKRGDFIKPEVDRAIQGKSSFEDQIRAIYKLIQSKVKWTGEERVGADNNIRKVYEKGSGSSAEINLLLVAALQQAKFNANPVLVSTRSNGKLPGDAPILSNFNYVIAEVNVGERTYLLDATDPFTPFDQLPTRCMNGKGRLIEKDLKENEGWIPLCRKEKSAEMLYTDLALDAQGKLSGNYKHAFYSLAASEQRDKIISQGLDHYFETEKEKEPSWTITDSQVNKLKEANDTLIESSKISTTANGKDNTTLYISLIPFGALKENPFKKETRLWPVDFPSPTALNNMIRIKIDSTYRIEELPKSAVLCLPNNDATYVFNVGYDEQTKTLTVSSKLAINKTSFSPEEYQGLRTLYSLITQKNSEKIVLKKKTGSA